MSETDWMEELTRDRAAEVGLVVAIVGTRHESLTAPEFAQVVTELLMGERPARIVSGGQRGVDTLARDYAKAQGIPFDEYPEKAERGTFSERCHARNQKMSDAADLVIALPCIHSKGTYDTVHRHVMKAQEVMRLPLVRLIQCTE